MKAVAPTPTPWTRSEAKRFGYNIYDSDGQLVAQVYFKREQALAYAGDAEDQSDRALTETNADFIVNAANHYSLLVKALTGMLGWARERANPGLEVAQAVGVLNQAKAR